MTSHELYQQLLTNPTSAAGVAVDWRRALQASVVLACVRVLSEDVAQVPTKVFRRRPDGGREEARDHWLYDIVHLRPNPWQTAFEFWQQIMVHLCLTGNAFVFKNTTTRGRVIELLAFEPGDVAVDRKDKDTITYDVTMKDGGRERIPAANMWHLRGMSWSNWMGLESVQLARESIGLAMASETQSASFIANGARLSGVIEHPGQIGGEALKNIRETWNKQYAGSGNAGATAILEEGMKFNALSMTGADAQLLEQRRFQVEEVCRTFRVYPAVIGHSDKAATYASAEQFFLAHVVHSLGPWFERLEQSANLALLGADRGHYVKFITTGLLRGDAKTRAEFYASGITNGWMTRNEARRLEDLNPRDGLDDPLVPLNMAGQDTQSGNKDG